MTYYYDTYGWLSDTPIEGRETDIAPMKPKGNMRPNFTGHKWVLMEYVEPVLVDTVEPTLEEKNLALEERVRILEEKINTLTNGTVI